MTRLEIRWQEVGISPTAVRKGLNLTLPTWVNDLTATILTITEQYIVTTD